MKTILLTAVLVGSLFLSALDSWAQSDPYYYWDGTQYYYWNGVQYQPYWPQAYDPYYELHVMHYQLYLPQYQYQSFPIFPPVFQPCCFVTGNVIARPAVVPVAQPVRARVPTMRRR